MDRVEDRLPRTERDGPSECVTEEVVSRVKQETGDDDFVAVDVAELRDRVQSTGHLAE